MAELPIIVAFRDSLQKQTMNWIKPNHSDPQAGVLREHHGSP